MNKKTLNGPGGIVLELDRSEWFPDDPGRGTPALVCYKGQTASLSCAIGEEEVWSDFRIPLSKKQVEWLEKQEVNAWKWIQEDFCV